MTVGSGERRKEILVNPSDGVCFRLPALLLCLAAAPPALAGEEPQALVRRADEAHRAGKYGSAAELYRQALGARPADAEVLYRLARSHAAGGEKPEAAACLNQAVAAGFCDAQRLRADQDFASIREERGYRQALAALAAAERAAQRVKARCAQKLGPTYRYRSDAALRLVVASDVPDAAFDRVMRTLRSVGRALRRDLFTENDGRYLTVVVPGKPAGFRKLFGRRARGFAGMYQPPTRTLYVNLATGFGTMIHEYTHALHHADRAARKQKHPIWIIEGFGSLYEQSGFSRAGRLRGSPNWRLPGLQAALAAGKSVSWDQLIEMSERRFLRKSARSYETARYLFYYLQEKGLLQRFYREYTAGYAKDPRGRATLEKVLGRPIAEVEPEWRKWVMQLSYGRKPFLGVRFDTGHQGGGARVLSLLRGGAAARGGMRAGDVILEMDGSAVEGYPALVKLLKTRKRGATVEFKLNRGGQEITVKVRLGV
jgi:hypothetical protein